MKKLATEIQVKCNNDNKQMKLADTADKVLQHVEDIVYNEQASGDFVDANNFGHETNILIHDVVQRPSLSLTMFGELSTDSSVEPPRSEPSGKLKLEYRFFSQPFLLNYT